MCDHKTIKRTKKCAGEIMIPYRELGIEDPKLYDFLLELSVKVTSLEIRLANIEKQFQKLP